jgi:hypothetical protein
MLVRLLLLLNQSHPSQLTSNSRFHPDFHNPQSQIQREMLQSVRDWLSKSPNQRSVIQRLNKDSVRNHRNLRIEGEGGTPASQGSFAEQEGHQLQHTVMGRIPGVGLFTGNAKGVEGGSPGYPIGLGGYPQGGGQQHGGLPGPPGYPGRPMGEGHQHGGGGQHGGLPGPPGYPGGPMGGGHQHGGGGYGSTSTYTPPSAAPSHVTTFPISGGGPPQLPSPHAAHHHPGSTGPHTQHGGYAPPSFPSGSPFPGPGQGGDGFSFPGSGAPSFPGGDGVSFPDTKASSYYGAPSFPDDGYSGPPLGGYNAPPHLGGYNPPHPGPPPHGYPAPYGPPPGFPNSGGYGESSPTEFPNPSARPEFPGDYNPSYPHRGGGGGW